jgi:hypothetical protein
MEEGGRRIPSGVVPFAPILFLYLLPYLRIISHTTLLTPHSSSISTKNVSLTKGILPPMIVLVTAQFHPD